MRDYQWKKWFWFKKFLTENFRAVFFVTVNFDSFSICLIWKKWITLCQVMIFAFLPSDISFLLWIHRFLLLYFKICLYCIKLINFQITFLYPFTYPSVSVWKCHLHTVKLERPFISLRSMSYALYSMALTVWVIIVEMMCVLTVQMIKLTKLVTKNNRHDQIDGNE